MPVPQRITISGNGLIWIDNDSQSRVHNPFSDARQLDNLFEQLPTESLLLFNHHKEVDATRYLVAIVTHKNVGETTLRKISEVRDPLISSFALARLSNDPEALAEIFIQYKVTGWLPPQLKALHNGITSLVLANPHYQEWVSSQLGIEAIEDIPLDWLDELLA